MIYQRKEGGKGEQLYRIPMRTEIKLFDSIISTQLKVFGNNENIT